MLLVFTQLSGMLKLHTLYWILVKILEVGFILPFIIFQPELRAGLEHIGRNTSIAKFAGHNDSEADKSQELVINEMVDALYDLASRKIGALIVLEGKTKINEIVNTGTKIEGKVTKQLLCNIFIPNTPLHDGAVVVREDRKSTRLNSSHANISYAVFCLKKKKISSHSSFLLLIFSH